MGSLSHAEKALLGLEDPGTTSVLLSEAEQMFSGSSELKRSTSHVRHRARLVAPRLPVSNVEDEISPVQEAADEGVDLSEVTSALRAIKDEVRFAVSELRQSQVRDEEPPSSISPASSYRIIRDHLGRAERVLSLSSDGQPMSYRVVRDELGRMTSVEYEA